MAHTQSCLIPIITWCHHFFHSNQYSAHEKQFKVWIESNRSLRCPVTTLMWRQVSQSPPPPVTKMRVPFFFAGDCACEIELRQTRVICYMWRQRVVNHAVCLQAEFQIHAVLSNENYKFYTTMIYPCFSRSVCFSMGSPAWGRFGLCSRASSLMSRWRDAPLVHARISNVTRRCKQIDQHSFQGRQMRFLVNVINHIVKIVRDI